MRTKLLAASMFAVAFVHAQSVAPWTMQRLPDTGQTRRYSIARGDDSDYTINPPAFRINGDGTVDDLVTGLQWQQTDGGEMKWDNAANYCRGLSLSGKSDWRLPYAQELFSIQNHGTMNPSLDTAVFTRSAAEYWWAAETRADNPSNAWATNAGGGIGAHPLTETVSAGGTKRFHARCVRHPAVGTGVASRYTDNGDGTVTDNQTGLMWQKSEGSAAITWEDGFAYAAALTLGGFNDWRVPNIKELRSLHSDYFVRPSINSAAFPGTPSALFWSSTTQVGQNGVTAWTLDFTAGVVSYNPKTDRLHLRAVRAGSGLRIAFSGIRNAASYADTAISPGEMIVVFGSQFGLSDAQDGRSVRINGTPATITSWRDDQINVIVPNSVADQTTATISVTSGGTISPALVVPVADAAPGLFTADSSGSGPAAAWNEDGSVNSADAPAKRGAIVVLYATGHGLITPPLALEVRIASQPCEVLYSGLVDGLPAGLLQLNVRVPVAVDPTTAAPVELKIGSYSSQATVTVAIQ